MIRTYQLANLEKHIESTYIMLRDMEKMDILLNNDKLKVATEKLKEALHLLNEVKLEI